MDEEILSLLSEIPKKKYLKKVIDVAINLNTDHNMFPSSYKNPITENLQKDLQISKEQTQRLLLALSKLIEVVCSYNF